MFYGHSTIPAGHWGINKSRQWELCPRKFNSPHPPLQHKKYNSNSLLMSHFFKMCLHCQMLQGAMSQEKYFTDIRRKLDLYQKDVQKRLTTIDIALVYFITSSPTQGFLAFSPQQLSEVGIISPFKVGKRGSREVKWLGQISWAPRALSKDSTSWALALEWPQLL